MHGPGPAVSELLSNSGFFLLNTCCVQHLWLKLFLLLPTWLFHLTGLYSLSCTLFIVKTVKMILNLGLGFEGMKYNACYMFPRTFLC